MNILLVGCGNIGTALLHAWLDNEALQKIIVVQPSLSKAADFKKENVVTFVASLQEVSADFKPDLVVLAIKPQKIDHVAPELSRFFGHALLVSLLTGVSIKRLAAGVPNATHIIRVMPNVALKVAQSVNLTYANQQVSDREKEQITLAFNSSGKMHWLPREELIDILTPISGSGPAYFFLLAEILVQITIDLGIEETVARDLIQQTFIGSAQLTNENHHFQSLVKAVTSKGGTTEAALNVLQPAFSDLMQQAINAALVRVKELAS